MRSRRRCARSRTCTSSATATRSSRARPSAAPSGSSSPATSTPCRSRRRPTCRRSRSTAALGARHRRHEGRRGRHAPHRRRGPRAHRDLTFLFYECEEIEDATTASAGSLTPAPSCSRATSRCCSSPPTGRRGWLQGHPARRRRDHRHRGALGPAVEGPQRDPRRSHRARRLAAYEAATVTVDGLDYHEALQAVGIRGGIAGNVVPDRCTVTVNYRYAPDKDTEQASPTCARSSTATR